MSDNPLTNFYRSKEIYVKLPTQGKWYSQPPKLTEDGEIGVLPMTLQDEIRMNIPDSLYNGESLFELFKSICPDIVDPYEIAMPDVDVLLLASRAATYNKKMTIETQCTHCETWQNYELDLAQILSKVTFQTERSEIEFDGLTLSIKPNTLKIVSANTLKTVETTRMLSELQKGEGVIPEDLKERYQESIQTATAATIAILADAIEFIKLPDGQIVDKIEHIVEWLANSNKNVIEKLQKICSEQNKNGIQDRFDFKCSVEECGKQFTGSVQYNPSFFFANRSPEQYLQNASKK